MTAFEEAAGAAFEPLTGSALELPEKVRRWQAGELADAEYRDALAVAAEDAEKTLAAVAALPDHPARGLYLASATLYVAHVDALEAAMTADHRDQVVLSARRLRELGDRIFDRGHVLVDPDFGDDLEDVTINLPEEVPDWVAEGLAPGPPLAPTPPPPADTPPLREETRPVQPAAAWQAAVQRAGAPQGLDLAGDVVGQAQAYVAAAEAMRDEPDPDGDRGRERSAILRLGWLVKAEAAWAQALGLDAVAQRVAAIDLPPE